MSEGADAIKGRRVASESTIWDGMRLAHAAHARLPSASRASTPGGEDSTHGGVQGYRTICTIVINSNNVMIGQVRAETFCFEARCSFCPEGQGGLPRPPYGLSI